ncbi:MAG: hypothetical protein ACLUEQ_00530 [Cloacibacillus evryensis]
MWRWDGSRPSSSCRWYALPLSATLWLIAGGALYTAGAIIFGLERPRFKLSWFGSPSYFISS